MNQLDENNLCGLYNRIRKCIYYVYNSQTVYFDNNPFIPNLCDAAKDINSLILSIIFHIQYCGALGGNFFPFV